MNNSTFNKGLGLTALGSFWWGVIGVIYFEYISYIGYVEVILHRVIWTSFFLIITTEILHLVLYHLRKKTGSFKIFPFWPNSKKSSKRIILVARKGGASPTELMSGLKLYNKKKLMTKKARLISEKGIFNFS